jgi:hypothetical protein
MRWVVPAVRGDRQSALAATASTPPATRSMNPARSAASPTTNADGRLERRARPSRSESGSSHRNQVAGSIARHARGLPASLAGTNADRPRPALQVVSHRAARRRATRATPPQKPPRPRQRQGTTAPATTPEQHQPRTTKRSPKAVEQRLPAPSRAPKAAPAWRDAVAAFRRAGTPACRWCRRSRSCSSRQPRSSSRAPCWRSSPGRTRGPG